jgi:HAD superfamily hydrolase (TIGR01490 family)
MRHTISRRGFAFFDVDDTLLRIKTMFSFQDYYYRHAGLLPVVLGRARAKRFDARFTRMRASGVAREDINRLYYQSFRGRRPAVVRDLARRWYAEVSRRPDRFYVPETVAALRAHQLAGVDVVFVSGSMVDIVRPVADTLGVEHIVATRVAVQGGRYTGAIIAPQTIGEGKARAVRAFLDTHDGDADRSWAYGDDISDVPMLSAVGHSVVVSRNEVMLRVAGERGWGTLLSAELDRTGGHA